MAVDFDTSGSLVLGASNDYATRVWTVADQRLRVSKSHTFYRKNSYINLAVSIRLQKDMTSSLKSYEGGDIRHFLLFRY